MWLSEVKQLAQFPGNPKIQNEDLKSIVFIFAFAFLHTLPLKNESKETDLNVGLKKNKGPF